MWHVRFSVSDTIEVRLFNFENNAIYLLKTDASESFHAFHPWPMVLPD